MPLMGFALIVDEDWRRRNPGWARCVMSADRFWCWHRRDLAVEAVSRWSQRPFSLCIQPGESCSNSDKETDDD